MLARETHLLMRNNGLELSPHISCALPVSGLQTLAKEVYPLVGGFHDTPFIVYMLKTQSWQRRPFLDSVFFEEEIPLNRHWVQVSGQQKAG
jgi:hypothetical protein